MTTTWERVQGDTNDTLTAQFNGVADLVGVTAIEAHVWRPTDSAPATTLTTTVTDATARTVTVQLGTWLTTATPGVWLLEVSATWGTGPSARTVTSPGGKKGQITVSAQGA